MDSSDFCGEKGHRLQESCDKLTDIEEGPLGDSKKGPDTNTSYETTSVTNVNTLVI